MADRTGDPRPGGWGRWLISRLASAVFVLLAVTLLVQFLTDLVPGDSARSLAGEMATEEQVEIVRKQLGLDRPFVVRYLDYVGGLVQGDLGTSLIRGVEVQTRLARTLPITMSLVMLALVIAIGIGVPAGTLAGLRPHGVFDRVLSGLTAAAISMPHFVIALLVIVPLSLRLGIFPAAGYAPLAKGVGGWLHHLALPSLVMALVATGEVARQTRAAIADTMERDYIRTARAVGLRPMTIALRRALKNAAVPIVTVIGVQVPRLIGSAVVIENVFGLPGIGTLAVHSVLDSDIPVLQGLVVVISMVMVLTNTLVDLSYGLFNPRLRGGAT